MADIGSPDGLTYAQPMATTRPAVTPSGAASLGVQGIFSMLNTAAGRVQGFLRDDFSHTQAMARIRADENIALSRQGFTTGRAWLDRAFLGTQQAQAPAINVGGGVGSNVLAGIMPYLPLLIIGVVAAKVLK